MDGLSISALLIFLAVFAFVAAGLSALESNSGRLRLWRLKSSQEGFADETFLDDPAGILFEDSAPFVNRLEPLAKAVPQRNAANETELRRRLMHAGFRRADAPRVYTLVRILATVGVSLLCGFGARLIFFDQTLILGAISVAALCSYLLPSVYLDARISSRRSSVEGNLASTIDLLAVSIDAGMGMSQALSRVAKEFERVSPVLAEELKLVAKQTSAGRTNREALRDFAYRVGSKELDLLVNMILQTERFGTSIADALRSHSEEMRAYWIQEAEERAGRAAILMLLPTSLIMFSILIVILGLGAIKASDLLG